MWKFEKEFRIRLGGNVYVNTPKLIVYQGTSLFSIRRNEDDGMVGIDFDVFNKEGQRIAIFKKGIIVQGDKANYEISTGHETYSVKQRSSGRLIARVQRRGVQGVELDIQVQMYLPNGFLLDAGPEGTNLEGITMVGNTFVNLGAAIVIS